MDEVIIWHNNKCSKSREAKKILVEQNVPHGTFEYLKDTFTKKDILEIQKKLAFKDITMLLRKTEELYQTLDIVNKSENEVLDLLIQNPRLIQRPIIIKGNNAVIARPMENLQNLLRQEDK